MGLFRSDEPLFAGVLHTTDVRARRAVTKGQDGIRRVLEAGEPVLAVVVDERTYDETIVLTDRRVLVMGRGGRDLVKATDVAHVPGAYAQGALFELDRMGVRIHVAAAAEMATLVNESVLKHRPRVVPTLNPAFYVDLLKRSGVPDTPVNRARLASRTAFIIGAQAGAFTARLGDPPAFEEFTARFATTGQADEMIDWLWAWHPACHQGLTRQLAKWHDGLLQPGSFLTDATNGEIPDSPAGDDAEAWRLVFERNRRP